MKKHSAKQLAALTNFNAKANEKDGSVKRMVLRTPPVPLSISGFLRSTLTRSVQLSVRLRK
jgi:hypothetical protein